MVQIILKYKKNKFKNSAWCFLLAIFCVFSLVFLNTCYAYYPKAKKNYHGVYPDYPVIQYGSGPEGELVKRGEYLAKAGDCIACHTYAEKGGQAYAGGLPIKTPFGTFYSPNITADKETGLGNWTFDDFVQSMHKGKRPDGSNNFPVYPYLYFSKVTTEDLRAIWAYLHVVPQVKQANRKPDVPFPFSWRFAQYGWKMLFFYPGDTNDAFHYDPAQSTEWNRGKYLVDGLGHCGMCHTPLNALGGPKQKYYLTGGFVDGFWAPNITRYGLASATVEQIAQDVFAKNQLINKAGPVAGPMAEVNHDSLQFLTLEDRTAIAAYLKSVKSEEPLQVSSDSKASRLAQGRKVYYAACHICHQEGQMGAPRIGDSENWALRLSNNDFNTLYRHATDGYNQMPVKGGCVTCSDEDIEAAVDYLINASLTPQKIRQARGSKVPGKPSVETGRQIYQKYCAVCHDSGALGSPKLGDKAAWAPILDKNFDDLISNTIKGSSKMPPRGGCKNCTNAELIATIKYIAQQSSDKNYSLW